MPSEIPDPSGCRVDVPHPPMNAILHDAIDRGKGQKAHHRRPGHLEAACARTAQRAKQAQRAQRARGERNFRRRLEREFSLLFGRFVIE